MLIHSTFTNMMVNIRIHRTSQSCVIQEDNSAAVFQAFRPKKIRPTTDYLAGQAVMEN